MNSYVRFTRETIGNPYMAKFLIDTLLNAQRFWYSKDKLGECPLNRDAIILVSEFLRHLEILAKKPSTRGDYRTKWAANYEKPGD